LLPDKFQTCPHGKINEDPMAPDLHESTERERRLDDVLTAYLKAVDAGQSVDRQRLLDSHPDLAAELSDFFAEQDRLHHRMAPLRAVAEAAADGTVRGSGGTLPTAPALGSFGDFQVLRLIAQGAMGAVDEARQELARDVEPAWTQAPGRSSSSVTTTSAWPWTQAGVCWSP
jgi:hypothetical protein